VKKTRKGTHPDKTINKTKQKNKQNKTDLTVHFIFSEKWEKARVFSCLYVLFKDLRISHISWQFPTKSKTVV